MTSYGVTAILAKVCVGDGGILQQPFQYKGRFKSGKAALARMLP